MERIIFRSWIAVVGMLFLLTLIPMRTHAGIGGKCPNIIVTWSDNIVFISADGGADMSLAFEKKQVSVQTSWVSSIESTVILRELNNNTNEYILNIEAGTCVWEAPTVSYTIIQAGSGTWTVDIVQGDYTDETDAYVTISLP